MHPSLLNSLVILRSMANKFFTCEMVFVFVRVNNKVVAVVLALTHMLFMAFRTVWLYKVFCFLLFNKHIHN